MLDAQNETRQIPTQRHRLFLVMLAMLPGLLFAAFGIAADPDPEQWLIQYTQGSIHSDAFEGLTRILPLFTAALGVACMYAAWCAWRYKTDDLICLTVGPALGLTYYLGTHGLTDPSFITLGGVLTISLLVGTPITALRALIQTRTASRAGAISAEDGTLSK